MSCKPMHYKASSYNYIQSENLHMNIYSVTNLWSVALWHLGLHSVLGIEGLPCGRGRYVLLQGWLRVGCHLHCMSSMWLRESFLDGGILAAYQASGLGNKFLNYLKCSMQKKYL